MVAINYATSLTLLKVELDDSLKRAETALEAWSENQGQDEHLTTCVECFSQLKGIFKVLGLPAATAIAEEMRTTATTLAGVHDPHSRSAVLSQSILLIGRYLEYVQLKNQHMPQLLVDGINDLRRVAGKPLILESHFFSVDVALPRDPLPDATELPDDLPSIVRRLRLMYQVGFLSLLRGEGNVHLKMMNRALTRLDRICGATSFGRLLWAARAALEAMISDDMSLNSARKLMLGQLDRQLKRLVYDGNDVLSEDLPLALLRECIYVASLCETAPGVVGEVKQVFGLRGGVTDAYLRGEMALMSGGGDSVVRSVAANLKEELGSLKQSLDYAAQGVADTDYKDVAEEMRRVAGTLVMVKLQKESDQLRDRADAVSTWVVDEVDPEGVGFQGLVDDLLMVENAVATLERSVAPGDDMRKAANNQAISLYQLDDARVSVVQECRSGLALVKRELLSFIDKNFDRMPLGNLPSTMSSVCGGLTFLELQRACAVLEQSENYIQSLIANAHQTPTEEQMETLADALTAVDYYLESMEENKPIGESVLEVAEQSMAELGYPVARPVGQ